jgi:hypothetical protein
MTPAEITEKINAREAEIKVDLARYTCAIMSARTKINALKDEQKTINQIRKELKGKTKA